VGLFDSTEEHPPSKILRYIITGLVFVALIVAFVAYQLRFHTEEKTIRHFMDALIAGHMDEAYKIWKPSETYSFKDFQEDWGPDGYYGPIKSFTWNTWKKPSRMRPAWLPPLSSAPISRFLKITTLQSRVRPKK
jgi:hypothetical protein